ncbi:MAG TPA: copper resistance CopC family protein [Acetobacteraceae bacterium]|jgi:methionine-rich copper-binding protein CopC|nr:copper resistance CopC family protein [Acetobacteraceae bacterium]
MRALLAALLLLAPLLAAGAASAHAILVASQPAAQSSVKAGPADIVLRYNSRIDQGRSRLTLRAASAETTLPLQPGSPADTLAAHAELRPGDYVVHWQVLAVDGHMTRGDVRFSVTP